MAKHSHSANIKHKKDRNDSAKSSFFLKFRRQLEQIIRSNGGLVTEKTIALANKNKFPKEKVYQIQKRILQEKADSKSRSPSDSFFFFEAPYGILLAWKNESEDEDEEKVLEDLISELRLKKLVGGLISAHFKLVHSLVVDKPLTSEERENLEALVFRLPPTLLEEVDYKEDNGFSYFFCSKEEPLKETSEFLKELFSEKDLKQSLVWVPLFQQKLLEVEEKKYFELLGKKLTEIGVSFTTNVEN